MSETQRFKLGTFAQRVELGFRDEVRTFGALLLAEIQRQLSTPGRGRVYARGRQQSGIGPETAKTAARRKSFNRQLGQVAMHLNAGAPDDIIGKRFKNNLHRASAAGDPPAPDTGTLKRSAFMEDVEDGVIVGVAAAYARPLEFGTPRIKPRPFMRPAFAVVQQRTGVMLGRVADRFRDSLGRG